MQVKKKALLLSVYPGALLKTKKTRSWQLQKNPTFSWIGVRVRVRVRQHNSEVGSLSLQLHCTTVDFAMDLLGSIMGSMTGPPKMSDKERERRKKEKEMAEKMEEQHRKMTKKFREQTEEKINAFIKDVSFPSTYLYIYTRAAYGEKCRLSGLQAQADVSPHGEALPQHRARRGRSGRDGGALVWPGGRQHPARRHMEEGVSALG